MMKTKLFRTMMMLAVVCILAVSSLTAASAAANPRYTDSETGYRVVILDELDLLTNAEEAKLTEDMQPLTAYGNIIFWTTDQDTRNEIDQARLKRKELFEFESAGIFAINMKVRKLTIQCYGDINNAVTDSLARSITNNVSSLATQKQYYQCAKEAYSQMLDVCENRAISEPMKITSFAVIAVMLGLIVALGVVFSRKFNPIRQADMRTAPRERFKTAGGVTGAFTLTYLGTRREHRAPKPTYSSSGSSCSSCSSCKSCSSCSSCSSCGGGGCGSGGSSSF